MFLGEFHHPFLSHEQVVILIGFFMAFLFCYLLVFLEPQNKKRLISMINRHIYKTVSYDRKYVH